MLREAMEAGALACPSGLDYPPGAFATTDELAALTAEAAKHGGFYHTHVRYPLGDRYLDPFREAIEIGRRGGGPVHITHFYHRQTHPGPPERLLALIDDARAEGLDVTLRHVPLRVGVDAAADPVATVDPGWRPGAAQRATRRQRRSRKGARRATRAWRRVHLPRRLGRRPAGLLRSPEANLRWEGRTLADVMNERGTDAVDTMCDLLLDEDLRVNQVTSGPWTEDDPPFRGSSGGHVRDGLHVHRRQAVAAHLRLVPAHPGRVRPRPRSAGPRGGRPQDDVGARGATRPDGSWAAARRLLADVVVFDPETVRTNATYDDPRQFPTGIDYVIVNGEVVVDDGQHTGALPGRVVRGARRASSPSGRRSPRSASR